MPTLTKECVKYHCRTCLTKLSGAKGAVSVLQNDSVVSPSEEVEEGEMQEFKDICINIASNSELRQLLAKYVDDLDEPPMTIYPPHMCLRCYDKLQDFEKFRKRARDSAEKLNALLSNNGVTKVELDYDEGDVEQDTTRVINNEDIYKLLLKDTLMETESVLLDSSAVATLASVELHDTPDPFDTTAPSRSLNSTGEFSAGEEDCSFDWQRSLIPENTSESSESSESEDQAKSNKERQKKSALKKKTKSEDHDNEDDDNNDAFDGDEKEGFDEKVEDLGADTEEEKKRRPRLRSGMGGNSAVCKKKQEKKKRRTKKEMEEHRRAEAEKRENKIKRRNKGTKNSFKCTQCNHCFAHKITLDAHVRKVHEGSKRPFQCDRCDKSYSFIGGLYTHIKEIHETEVRSYSCDHPGCERIYTSYIAMQKHKRLKHTDIGVQKKYVCEQCGATFNQSGNLKYHRRTKHPTEAEQAEKEKSKERYECETCKKLFHSRYTLKYHTLQLHSNDMKYECNICGRRMAKKFMLVQHMLVHSTDKMPCEHCGKQFIRKFELEAHIRAVHMKLKPFECQYCSECFASRKTLRHHEYIHTGEKPYVCDICGQAYRQQTCLKNHRKSHEKLGAEALLAANINRTLMSTFLSAPPPTQSPQTTAIPHMPLGPLDSPII